MKKRHLAKRRLRFEGLEARLTMSAIPALNVHAAIPVQPAAAAPAVVAPVSSTQAARAAAVTTHGKVNGLSPNWSGVEVNDTATAAGGAPYGGGIQIILKGAGDPLAAATYP